MHRDYEDTVRSLTDLLAEIPAMLVAESRRLLVTMLTRRDYRVPETVEEPGLWTYCYRLIDSVANQPNGLQELSKCIWNVDRSGLADGFAAEIRRLLQSDIFTLRERIDFIRDIASYIPVDELNLFYREATDGQIAGNDITCVADLIDELEGLPFPYEPCHPLILLTEAISQRAATNSTKAAARDWSDRLAMLIDERMPGQERGSERRRLDALRRRVTGHPVAGTERVILVHVVEPWGPDQDHYLYQLLMYRGKAEPEFIASSDTARDLDGVRQQVITELQGVIRRLSRFDDNLDIRLEFFLPRTLLCHPVEDWSSQTSGRVSLGMLFVVVVRDLDRLGDPVLWQACKRKWRGAQLEERASGELFSRWITCMDPPVGLPGVLPDRCVAVGLTFPPPPQGERTDLVDALDAGTPIALWPRIRCDHPHGMLPAAEESCLGARFKAQVCAHAAGRQLVDLPALVWDMRKEQNPGNGPGFVLLWDDPAHFPGVSQHRLAPPDRLEES